MKTKLKFSAVRIHHRAVCYALATATTLAVMLSTTPARATIISAPPTRSASSGTINNAFDNNNTTGWTSGSDGTNATAQFQFGVPTAFDRFVFINPVTAGTTTNVTSQISLSFDGGTTNYYSIHALPDRMTGNILELGPITATTIDLRITQVMSGTLGTNVGAGEIFFVRPPPTSHRISGVSVLGFSSEQASSGPVTNLLNLRLGSGRPTDSTTTYISNGDGTNTFVDFDLGLAQAVTGFDFFDRSRTDGVGTVTGFDMIFSMDTIFDTNDVKLSYSKLGSEIGVSDEFDGVFARYVRYDVTSTHVGTISVGGANFTFYTPEPSTSMLLGVGGLLLWRRRKNRKA